MVRRAQPGVSIAVLAALICGGILLPAAGQELSRDLNAGARLFPEIGPGLIAVKRDAAGRYYILAAPAKSVAIYAADGKRTGQIPNVSSQGTTIVFAEDIDVDANGRLYVADRGANAVKIFAADGSLAATISIPAPTSVEALSNGEFAVTTLRSARLVSIYDARGNLLRTFGDLSNLAQAAETNRSVNLSRLAGDPAGYIYFALMSASEPTIRKYDRHGYAAAAISVTSIEPAAETQAPRKDGLTFERRGDAPPAKPVIGALGIDPATQEIWAAIGNRLLHLDKDGVRSTAYRTFTPDGARLEPKTILVESDRLLLGADPLGVFVFARPDKLSPPASTR
jgi:sugar lactone lactonase YvrE